MRGDGDMPKSEQDDIALSEKIFADQHVILARHRTPMVASGPQVCIRRCREKDGRPHRRSASKWDQLETCLLGMESERK